MSLIELSWVLQTCFDVSRAQLVGVLKKILGASNFKIEHGLLVAAATKLYNAGSSDFDDCLIARISEGVGCEKIMTFDRNAAKIAGMILIT